MSAGFKHTAARVITSNRHMAATAIKGLNYPLVLAILEVPEVLVFLIVVVLIPLFLNQVCAKAGTWFLKIAFVREVGMRTCVCVSASGLLKTSHVKMKPE